MRNHHLTPLFTHNLIHNLTRRLAVCLSCLLSLAASAQTTRNTFLYASLEYMHTSFDRTKFGNPDAVGLGIQAIFNRRSFIQPVAEVSAFLFSSDKVYRTDDDGHEIIQLSGMINVMAGLSLSPCPYVSASIVGGAAFVDNGTRFVYKPSLTFYFPRNQRFRLGISLIDVVHRDKPTGQDYRGMNLTFGVRLF